MPLSKKQKTELVDSYKQQLSGASSIIVCKQSNINVNDINNLRIQTEEKNSNLCVVKKKIFLKSLDQT